MRFLIALVWLGLMVAMISCAPPQPAGEGTYTKYPYDLRAEVNDGMMTVSWKVAGKGLISGYNIYLARSALSGNVADTEPFNTSTFAGDIDPSDGIEHYEAVGLINGTDYYVSVAVVYPDGRLSQPTKEIHAVCGPRREIELQFRYAGSQAGFSLDRNDYVVSDDVANDVYFYSKDGTDYLASPSRLDGFLRATKLRKIRSGGSLRDAEKTVEAAGSPPGDDRVAVKEGDWIWLMTPDRATALFHVLALDGESKERRLRMFVAYTPNVSTGHL
ncbi:MAG: hypothetical protein ABIE70_05685 [bacterium]